MDEIHIPALRKSVAAPPKNNKNHHYCCVCCYRRHNCAEAFSQRSPTLPLADSTCRFWLSQQGPNWADGVAARSLVCLKWLWPAAVPAAYLPQKKVKGRGKVTGRFFLPPPQIFYSKSLFNIRQPHHKGGPLKISLYTFITKQNCTVCKNPGDYRCNSRHFMTSFSSAATILSTQ